MDDRVSIIYTTFPNIEQAEKISRQLMDEHLIACVNLLPGMQAIYRWQGAVESGNEVIGILKTRKSLVKKTIDRLLELHPYETPCALEISVESGASGYIDWLTSNTSSD